MSAKTPIDRRDIQKGDLIRVEYGPGFIHRAEEYVAPYAGITPSPVTGAIDYFLLDRPKKIIHAKGTTLYATETIPSFFEKGDAATVTRNFVEGDRRVYLATGSGDYGWFPRRFTTEKPRKIKWAKGTKLWFVDSAENRGWYEDRIGTEHVVEEDVYEGDDYYVDDYFASRFTDVEPITLVAVPLTAIKKLRDDNYDAAFPLTTTQRSRARSTAIRDFLDERSIRLALGEDEQPW